MAHRTELGTAIIEAAVWLTMLLPVALLGLWVVATVHDQNVLRVVPDATLREVRVAPIRWKPNGHGGGYEVDVDELRNAVSTISRNALAEAQQGVVKATNLSSRACFWIYSVNVRNGELESPIRTECDARGPFGTELSVEGYVTRAIATVTGIPRDALAGATGFVDRVVVTGVVVGGELPSLRDGTSPNRVSFGAVSCSRQEIAL
jgi:hypothetical protein